MSSVSVRVPSPRRAPPARQLAGLAVALAAGLIAMWFMAGWLDGPARVDLVVENPTPYPLLLTVRAPGDTSVLPVGYISKNSTMEKRDVIDHGDRWVFEFSYAGSELPAFERSRAELERADWRISVPRDAATRLQSAGHRPPP